MNGPTQTCKLPKLQERFKHFIPQKSSTLPKKLHLRDKQKCKCAVEDLNKKCNIITKHHGSKLAAVAISVSFTAEVIEKFTNIKNTNGHTLKFLHQLLTSQILATSVAYTWLFAQFGDLGIASSFSHNRKKLYHGQISRTYLCPLIVMLLLLVLQYGYNNTICSVNTLCQ